MSAAVVVGARYVMVFLIGMAVGALIEEQANKRQ